MPSFYPTTLPRQLPLTPPDLYAFDNISSAGGMQSSAAAFYGNNGMDTRYVLDARENIGYPKQATHQTIRSSGQTSYARELDNHTLTSMTTSFAHRENAYGHVGAPVLPPIRIPDRTAIEQTYYQNTHAQRTQTQSRPKEEKAVGGVSAHLDYEMEQMVDFVSEMTRGMYDLFQSHICLADIDIARSVQPTANVTADFRKYVSQILTSTRLPSSTILLGLHYLATRMTLLSDRGVYSSSTGHLYHMLTTALMLGSKFLDDNTFQNRSWAEVSHISVLELNTLEMEWLVDINWILHIDPTDSQGLSAWLAQWKIWTTKRDEEVTLDALKLTPLDASLRRQHSLNKQLPATPLYPPYSDNMFAMASKERVHSLWQSPAHDQWPPIRSLIERSPPSAPESGPNTPEWYGRHGVIGYGQSTSMHGMRSMPPLQPLHMHPASMQSSYYAPYSHQYTPSPWSGHSIGCMCGYCLPQHDRFAMAHAYGPQPVAG
ncbi:hypothetical protein MMC13_002484 [Lambiella insularis]|nr:hypothetical protein [Lambiella insularis]